MTKKLLLVDDDEDDVSTFGDALKELSISVHLQHCSDGHSALTLLADSSVDPPDIIFLDVNMPAMTGWECLREIKSIAGAKTIPIIMYSTADLHQQGLSPADVGAAAFYQKCDSFAELKRTLSEVLSTDLYSSSSSSSEA